MTIVNRYNAITYNQYYDSWSVRDKAAPRGIGKSSCKAYVTIYNQQHKLLTGLKLSQSRIT